MFKATRRVIARINDGISEIAEDKEIESFIPYESLPSFEMQDLFYTEDNPQSLATKHLNNIFNIAVPEGAFRFTKIRMPTKKEIIEDLKKSGQEEPDNWYTFNMHSTDSVDYIYILSGQITCVVGTEPTELKPGDFLVQVGSEHTWLNDNDEPCYLLCIVLGIKPSNSKKDMIIK